MGDGEAYEWELKLTKKSRFTLIFGPMIMALVIALIALGVVLLGFNSAAEAPVERGTSYGGQMRVESVEIDVTDGSGAGAASDSGTTETPVYGHIYAIFIDYDSAMPSTTDISVSMSSPALTLMTITDSATDAWYYPAVQQTGSTGSGISGAYDRAPVAGTLTIWASGTNSNTTGTVYVYWGQ